MASQRTFLELGARMVRCVERDGIGNIQPVSKPFGERLFVLGRVHDGQVGEKTNES